MADIKLRDATALQTVIDKNAALADGARAAGDYDNGTALDLYCSAYLTVQYDTTAPSAGDKVAELYLLLGDGEASEVFPVGGDGTVGANVTPQMAHHVGSFESRNPSTSVDEVLSLDFIPLGVATNRFVVVNTSGQQFDATWQLDIKPIRHQVA